MLRLTFFSKLDCGSYIISIAKTVSKKIRVLICSMKFLSPDVVLYFYKSTIQPCMEYQWTLLYRYYFGRCSSEPAQLVPLPYSGGKSSRYSDGLHDFSVTIPRCYKDAYVNSFSPHTTSLCNSLPVECFPLTYDLNGFIKSRINRHLLTLGSL